jgi:hypothetical protein
MKCNVGGIDRVLRTIVGLALVGMAASNIIGVWGWIGMIPLATGLFRFCPMYSIAKINSCGKGCDDRSCSK